jgi:hypothetical protein
VLVRGAWGAGPSEFGRRRDPETRAQGPASLAVDAHGRLLVLDQINRRIQRFDARGQRLPPIPIGDDAAEDLAPAHNGTTLVLDRLAERNVQLYDDGGRLRAQVPLVGPEIPESGIVTGLFTDDAGDLYVERAHRLLVRIADAGGGPVDRTTLPGRPSRDGQLFLNAAIGDRAAGQVLVSALARDGQLVWQTPVSLGAPVLYLVLFDSDAAGSVYLGGRVGHESAAPPYRVVDEAIVLVALSPGGAPRGSLTLPAAPSEEESFRELTVGDDGTIYRMVASADGVRIEAYRL